MVKNSWMLGPEERAMRGSMSSWKVTSIMAASSSKARVAVVLRDKFGQVLTNLGLPVMAILVNNLVRGSGPR